MAWREAWKCCDGPHPMKQGWAAAELKKVAAEMKQMPAWVRAAAKAGVKPRERAQSERPTKEQMFCDIAKVVARRSHCTKKHVGCVITDTTGQRIAIGYNGLAAGGPNTCGAEPGERCACVHAEANAVAKAHWVGDKIAYVTETPCDTCKALLTNAGVTQILFCP
jgi:dCMP deaminase